MPFGFHSLFGDRPSRSDVSLPASHISEEYYPSDEIIDKQVEEEESREVTRRVGRLLTGGDAAKSSSVERQQKGVISKKGVTTKRGKTTQKRKGQSAAKGGKQRKPATKTKKKPKQTRGKSTLSKRDIEEIIRSLSAIRQKPRKATTGRQRR